MSNQNNNFKFRDLPWGWIILGVTLWFMFPWIYSVFFNFILKNPKEYGESFGAVGDIYGSLNALFTSATLAIVVYSTLLQRQANEDARVAMEDQLREARRSSEEQIVQARASTEQQLALAQATHDAQIKETKNTFFTSQFYALLNLKENKFYKLRVEIKNQYYEQDQIFVNLSCELTRILQELDDELSLDYLEKKFLAHVDASRTDTSDRIFSYFLIYTSLIKLIQNSCLEDYEKQTYYEILSNSMRLSEQVVFFWVSCFIPRFKDTFKNITIFLQFYDDIYLDMAYKFQDRSYFSSGWYHKFEELDFLINNPA
ncbi:hypothetical protein [Acinetobacter gyllenbergii]|uniref:hypothetical protein n=1 Tax=Acinetobacter gyllenbergii TaxID=134534 RepID=UPI003F56742F